MQILMYWPALKSQGLGSVTDTIMILPFLSTVARASLLPFLRFRYRILKSQKHRVIVKMPAAPIRYMEGTVFHPPLPAWIQTVAIITAAEN